MKNSVWIVYWVSYLFLKLLSWLFFPLKAYGREHIPPRGGYIFASNHGSYLDPLIIGLCVWRRISYMGKDSLFEHRFLGGFLRAVGTFPVRRGQPDIGALREAIRRLRGGCPLVLFPQGTRLEPGQVPTPHPGIGFLAAKSRVPVVPVYIEGSEQVLPRGAKCLHRHPVRVIFGPPVLLDNSFSHDAASRKIVETIFRLPHSFSGAPSTAMKA